MSRKAQTDTERIEAYIAAASKVELMSLGRAVALVQAAKYPEDEPKPAAKRRGPGKKPNGAEKESAGVGFGSNA